MILDRVTVTGADESIRPTDLVGLTKAYPFVEWGILLSRNAGGHRRFPGDHWIEAAHGIGGMPLAGHLCGRWTRDLARGVPTFWMERPALGGFFDRIQLNFHGETLDVDLPRFADLLLSYAPARGWIVQLDGVNDALLPALRGLGVAADGLVDLSHGTGALPRSWPVMVSADGYRGYAGGLSPNNLDEQLAKIERVVPAEARIWIDVETRVRSNNDHLFDLALVERFLLEASRWVNR